MPRWTRWSKLHGSRNHASAPRSTGVLHGFGIRGYTFTVFANVLHGSRRHGSVSRPSQRPSQIQDSRIHFTSFTNVLRGSSCRRHEIIVLRHSPTHCRNSQRQNTGGAHQCWPLSLVSRQSTCSQHFITGHTSYTVDNCSILCPGMFSVGQTDAVALSILARRRNPSACITTRSDDFSRYCPIVRSRRHLAASQTQVLCR